MCLQNVSRKHLEKFCTRDAALKHIDGIGAARGSKFIYLYGEGQNAIKENRRGAQSGEEIAVLERLPSEPIATGISTLCISP